MNVLHIVNTADAQSVPLELALRMKRLQPSVTIAAFYAAHGHPADHPDGTIVELGAKGPADPQALKRLNALIRTTRPDIIHMHHAVSAFWATWMSRGLRPWPKLIKTEHNDHAFIPRHQMGINTLIYPMMSRVVCNSDTTLASIGPVGRGILGDRGVRIYNGVDITRVRAPGIPVRPRKAKVIGTVGRLVPQKNYPMLLRAFAMARETEPGLELEIVGNGPLRSELEAQARALGLGSAVRFLGGLERNDVYAALGTWDGFIIASAFEGFCNAMVEALAAGLPVAASDIKTLREVAGPHATFFDPSDVGSMADALANLPSQEPTGATFAERYDIERAAQLHLNLYDALLDAKPAAAPPDLLQRTGSK